MVGTNYEGRFVVACSEPINVVLDPEMAEAFALRRAVQLAWNGMNTFQMLYSPPIASPWWGRDLEGAWIRFSPMTKSSGTKTC